MRPIFWSRFVFPHNSVMIWSLVCLKASNSSDTILSVSVSQLYGMSKCMTREWTKSAWKIHLIHGSVPKTALTDIRNSNRWSECISFFFKSPLDSIRKSLTITNTHWQEKRIAAVWWWWSSNGGWMVFLDFGNHYTTLKIKLHKMLLTSVRWFR